jgi:hypothetical protein
VPPGAVARSAVAPRRAARGPGLTAAARRPRRPGGASRSDFMVIGQVVSMYIDDRFVTPEGRVDTGAMRPIMRGGYFDYFRLKRAPRRQSRTNRARIRQVARSAVAPRRAARGPGLTDIDDRFVTPEGRVDTGAMRPIMRGGYFDYFTVEWRYGKERLKRAPRRQSRTNRARIRQVARSAVAPRRCRSSGPPCSCSAARLRRDRPGPEPRGPAAPGRNRPVAEDEPALALGFRLDSRCAVESRYSKAAPVFSAPPSRPGARAATP